MLQPVTTENRRLFDEACTRERVFGSKCRNSLDCYGPDRADILFRVGVTPEGEPSAALYLHNGVLLISGDDRLPPEEVADFVREHGVAEVDTSLEHAQKLQALLGGEVLSSFYMVHEGPAPEGDFSCISPAGRLEDVFSVLQQSHQYYRDHLRLEDWSPDILLRREKGFLELFELERDGRIIGTGSICSMDEECGVIAAVAVIPEYRKRGLGALMSRFLTARIKNGGRTPRLISGYDAVAELYRGIGYVDLGRWGELYL